MRDLLTEILDRNCDDARRVRLIERAGDAHTEETATELIKVAQTAHVSSAVSAAAGVTLARVCFAEARGLDDLSMAEMTGDAYLAYDQELSRLLRKHPEVHLRRTARPDGRP